MNLSKNVKLLALFNFLTDFSLFAPIAILYFARVSGSFGLGMSIFAIAQVAAAAFELPTGIVSDLVGRKMTIVLGSVAGVGSAVFYAVGGSYWILVAGAVCEGLARAFYSGNNDAFLRDTLADDEMEHEYEEYLGKTSAANQIALALSAIGGSLMAAWSFPVLLWLSVIPQVIKLIVSVEFQEPKHTTKAETNILAHTKEAVSLFWKNVNLRTLSLASILGFAIGESGYQFRAAFLNTLWPLWAVGLSNVISNIGASLSFYYSGKLIKKFSAYKLIITGLAYSRVANIIALVWPTIGSPALMGTTSAFYGTTEVAQNALLQNEFSHKQRATMGSLNSLAGSVGFAVISVFLGLFADRIGPRKALLVLQLMSLITVGLYMQLLTRITKESNLIKKTKIANPRY